jgi:hypothetical protein
MPSAVHHRWPSIHSRLRTYLAVKREINAPDFPNPGDPGDVAELQMVLAGVPLDSSDPQVAEAMAKAAKERCSVSGASTAGGASFDCDIKDVLTIALAIEGKGPGLSAVCSRNSPGNPLGQ